MKTKDFEKKMRLSLSHFGLENWDVYWLPEEKSSIRGHTIPDEKIIQIFDINSENAWQTFIHEIFEIKLSTIINPYQQLINILIGYIEKKLYQEKERLIDSLQILLSSYKESTYLPIVHTKTLKKGLTIRGKNGEDSPLDNQLEETY